MRYPAGHKATVRQRILEEAVKTLREEGFAGVNIAPLMARVGLTHGGFYRHFQDRDELLIATLEKARESHSSLLKEPAPDDHPSLDSLLERYLDPSQQREHSPGQLLATLASEGSRQSPPIQDALHNILQELLSTLDLHLAPEHEHPLASEEALSAASAMLGALILAQYFPDEAQRAHVLHATRAMLQRALHAPSFSAPRSNTSKPSP